MSTETTAAELAAWLDAGEDLAVVDVRDAHAYRQGHIPGAENVPITEMDDSFLTREWPALIVLVDYTGDTAEGAAPKIGERLAETEVSFLVDGMSSWDGETESGF
ncbi:MAG: rhodanese-like domain-containing protein [Haloferacaceae archaeon]